MNRNFLPHLRDFCRRMRIRLKIVLPLLAASSAAAIKASAPILLPCAGVFILCGLLQEIDAVSALIGLIRLLLVAPAAAAAIVYAVDAFWEKRSVTPIDAVNLIRIRFRQIFLTGAAAWLIVMTVISVIRTLLMLVLMLLGGVFALLTMIPILGALFSAIGTAAVWLASLLSEYASHAALMIAMLVLIADGIGGRGQFDRSVSFIRNGGKRLWEALILLFGAWILVGAAGSLLSLITPALGAVVSALLTVCSMAAMCVIYLREREEVSFC